jgi:hypothetical protein
MVLLMGFEIALSTCEFAIRIGLEGKKEREGEVVTKRGPLIYENPRLLAPSVTDLPPPAHPSTHPSAHLLLTFPLTPHPPCP